MKNKKLLNLGLVGVGILTASQLAFKYEARRSLLRRDSYTCQCSDCVVEQMIGVRPMWREGWNLQAAHYPELHKPYPDTNIRNGRALCTMDHLIEEISRGNDRGAALLYTGHTIRNYDFLEGDISHDWKPPLEWFYDWVESDVEGRKGLRQVYIDEFVSTMNGEKLDL